MLLASSDIASNTIDADIGIFGAGPAGITLARALSAKGFRVALIESGGFATDPERQALFHGTSIGEPMAPEQGRYRVFGGASTHWTGRCAKLDPIDLEKRAWIPDSGWPISYEDLARFYPDAATMCGFPREWEICPESFERLQKLPPPPETVTPFLWRFQKVHREGYRDFGRDNLAEIRSMPSLAVFTKIDLVGVVPTADQSGIQEAVLRDQAGRKLHLVAKRFVLACGGIENARLLLNFFEHHRQLFFQVGDSIGRRFMQHPRTITADIEADPSQTIALQHTFNNFGKIGTHFETGFALTAAAQRKYSLVNASAVLRYVAGFQSLWRDALARPRHAIGALGLRARGKPGPFSARSITVHVDLEQVPDPESRLMLDRDTDALGLRKILVDWRISSTERRAAAFLTRAIGNWIAVLGLGTLHAAPDLDETGALTDARMLESFHHIGGTRMSADPSVGVVDPNLRVHGVHNLYVTGTSVMPTGGHANPTLTILGLTLRLAEHLAAFWGH